MTATITPIAERRRSGKWGSSDVLVNKYATYLGTVRRLSKNTVKLRTYYARKTLTAHPDVTRTTTAHLQDWISANAEWTPETVNVVISTVRSFYGWAVAEGVIPVSPAAVLRPVRVPQKPAPIASDNAVLWAIGHAPESDAALVLLGAECGLRAHEMAKLHTADRDGDWLTVIGKGGQSRLAYISPELAFLLDGIESRRGYGYYFPGRTGGHVSVQYVYNHIKRWTGLNPHALRHRAGTAVYRAGGNDLRLAQVFLGHASPDTTARYVHVERDDLRRASELARVMKPRTVKRVETFAA